MTAALRIPHHMTIRGRRWVVRHMTQRERAGKHRTDLGYCDPDRHEILIDPKQSRIDQERTFIHEVLHAAAGRCTKGALEAEVEEHTIRRIEAALRDVLASGDLLKEAR